MIRDDITAPSASGMNSQLLGLIDRDLIDKAPESAHDAAALAAVFDRTDALDLVDQFLDLGSGSLDLELLQLLAPFPILVHVATVDEKRCFFERKKRGAVLVEKDG